MMQTIRDKMMKRFENPHKFYRSEKKIMELENITEITDLALANLLDVIPLISNTGEEAVNPAILRIYERNAAVLQQN